MASTFFLCISLEPNLATPVKLLTHATLDVGPEVKPVHAGHLNCAVGSFNQAHANDSDYNDENGEGKHPKEDQLLLERDPDIPEEPEGNR